MNFCHGPAPGLSNISTFVCMWLQLDILAGTIRRGNLTGRVLVNGRPMQPSHFRKLNCYILQRDVLLATATVGIEADQGKGLLVTTFQWVKMAVARSVGCLHHSIALQHLRYSQQLLSGDTRRQHPIAALPFSHALSSA